MSVKTNFSDAWAERNKSNPFLTGGPADEAALGVQGLGDVSTVAKRDALGRVIKYEGDSADGLPGIKL